MKISRQTRFDDAVHDSTVAYHGFNYEITTDSQTFKVRTYDDEPGVSAVIAPIDAQVSPRVGELAHFIQALLGAERLKFYRGRTGAYRFVDPRSLRIEEE